MNVVEVHRSNRIAVAALRRLNCHLCLYVSRGSNYSHALLRLERDMSASPGPDSRRV